MKVTVSTAEYRNSHGKEPRGYGIWMFVISGVEDVGGVISRASKSGWVEFTGTYGTARAKAVALAKTEGVREIRVGS
jgi:hypothetical protein